MPTTVRDLLEEPELRLELLVDGDLDRPIRWVHVTELADASPYLGGDEFVLTAGVWRGRRHSAEAFVRALSSRDVAGIGYGLLEGDDHAPAAVVRACRQLGVPLVVIPVSTPFVAISQWFVERLGADREADLRATLAVTSDLLTAAESEPVGDALAAVARVLHRATGCPVWICDGAGVERARAGRPPDAETRRLLQAALTGPDLVADGWTGQLVGRPIGASSATAAAIFVSAEPGDLRVRSRVDAARPVVGLVLARERAVRETERRLAGEVVSLVLGRQVETAEARMPYYGLDPAGPLLPVVAVVTDRDRALEAAERWLTETDRVGIAAVRGDELMLLLSAEDCADTGRPVRLASALGRAVRAVSVGVGSVAPDLRLLRRGLVQARQAAELGRRRGDGVVVSQDQTSRHALLLALQDQDVLDAFREALLASLEAHDAEHGTDLLRTLRAFLERGGRWQETADHLVIHVNTLRNRLERVEALTGRSLAATSDRVDLWLALQA